MTTTLKSLHTGSRAVSENATDKNVHKCIDAIKGVIYGMPQISQVFINLALQKFKVLGKGAILVQYKADDYKSFIKKGEVRIPAKYLSREDMANMFITGADMASFRQELVSLIDVYNPEKELVLFIDIRYGIGYSFFDRVSFK